MVLKVTEMLRRAKVVGKFVSFMEKVRRVYLQLTRDDCEHAPEYGRRWDSSCDEETFGYLWPLAVQQNPWRWSVLFKRREFRHTKGGEWTTAGLEWILIDSTKRAGPKRPQDRSISTVERAVYGTVKTANC